MKYFKTVKRLGIFLICFGILLGIATIRVPGPGAVGGTILALLCIVGPGIWLVVVASKMKRAPLVELLKKCPYCAEDIFKDAIVCKHCKRELNVSIHSPKR